jgi:4'-phosphopantetheinyl transferase
MTTGTRLVQLRAGVWAAASEIGPLSGLAASRSDLDAARGLPAARARPHLAACVLLRLLVAQAAGPAAASSLLAARAHGQPFLAAAPLVGVSMSHTDDWVAAAVHLCGQVGVDVQAPVAVTGGLLQRCCTPSARLALSRMAEETRDVEFAWIWSVQEACVKTTGLGLAGLPWAVPVEAGQRCGRWRQIRWVALRGRWPIPVSCAHGRGQPEVTCRCAD